MPDIYLRQGEAAPADVRLYDPTASPATNASPAPDGIEATIAVGAVTVTADANTTPAGVSATSTVGSAAVTADANALPSGVAATAGVGSATVTAEANTAVFGVGATAAVGAVTLSAHANVSPSGVLAASAVGDPAVLVQDQADATAIVGGVEAVASVGAVAVEIPLPPTRVANLGWGGRSKARRPKRKSVEVSVVGVGATCAVGSVAVIAEAKAPAKGLAVTAFVTTRDLVRVLAETRPSPEELRDLIEAEEEEELMALLLS